MTGGPSIGRTWARPASEKAWSSDPFSGDAGERGAARCPVAVRRKTSGRISMTRFQGFSLLAVTAAAALVACSSSSSGSTKTTYSCATFDPAQMSTPTCRSCVETKCASQASDEYGPNYGAQDYSGGACGSFNLCV